jgi:secreted Zn-dependent insulinase-like peptidase
MFKKLGPQERIHNEIKSIADADFKFANERNALCVVHSLAYAMQLYPPADYLTGSELHSEYDPDDIKMTLNNLEPRKMNVIVYCNKPPSGINYSKSEKWFGTKYTQQG